MKRTVSILSILMALVLMLSMAACAGDTTTTTPDTTPTETQVKNTLADNEVMNIYTLKGPTGMGMAQMIADEADEEDKDRNFVIAAAPEDVSAAIINGDADIAACPVNLASVLYNKTGGRVELLALNTLGVTYILTNGTEVNTIEDLRGKTIISAGQGATPEYILTKLLTDSGLEIGKDVFVEFKSEHSDVASLLAAGEAQVALLPEPNVTATSLQNADVKVALDLTKEWEAKYGTKLVQGCIIGRKDFVDAYAGEVDEFLEEYKESVDFINTASDEAAQMIVDAGIIPKAPLAKKAIPNSYITFITGEEMKTLAVENLQVLFAANSASIGGNLPNADFYYNYTYVD
ncbi:MAG: ABC transporter substrate-binding protein [Ruminococcaceae bacterium]|nr:ABC transporter substrate-binding protein [Oscillospiraceae bacterium]